MPIVKNWLVRRSLRHYWRTNLAVVAGVATATAVLSGALLVGHSIRESLRDVLFERLGSTGIAVTADRFFREELAEALAAAPSSSPRVPLASCSILHLRGVVTHEAERPQGVRGQRLWRRRSLLAFPRSRRRPGPARPCRPDRRAAGRAPRSPSRRPASRESRDRGGHPQGVALWPPREPGPDDQAGIGRHPRGRQARRILAAAVGGRGAVDLRPACGAFNGTWASRRVPTSSC